MIDVQNLYLLVQDYTRKDQQGGYISNDEFNRSLNYAQELLFEYYYSQKDEREGQDALINFQAENTLSVSSARTFVKPANFKKLIEASVTLTPAAENECSASSAMPGRYPVHFPARNELQLTLSSAIRGPNVSKGVLIGEVLPSAIRVYPTDAVATLFIRYYTQLTQAERAVTLNFVTEQEDYDASSSTQLQWAEGQIEDFVDLMLLFKGVILRDTDIVNWVQAHKATLPIITQ